MANEGDIASAVQGYVKALRILGHERTCLEKIADALRLSATDVQAVFTNFKITGASIAPGNRTIYSRATPVESPTVNLKRHRP